MSGLLRGYLLILLGLRQEGKNLAGWVARTRPLSGPLSPRGPQPVPVTLGKGLACLNGPTEPTSRYAGLGTSAPVVLLMILV